MGINFEHDLYEPEYLILFISALISLQYCFDEDYDQIEIVMQMDEAIFLQICILLLNFFQLSFFHGIKSNKFNKKVLTLLTLIIYI